MSQDGDNVNDLYQGESRDFFKEYGLQLDRPVSNRTCRDVTFVVIFFLLLGGYVGFGGYIINQVYTQGYINITPTTAKILASFTLDSTKLALGYVIAMMSFALGIAIFTLFMIRYYPFCAYVFILVSAFAGLIALMAMSFVYQMMELGILLAIAIVITFIVWMCYRKELQSMVIIMKTVALLLSARPLIFLLTLISLFYGILISAFWIAGYWSIITFYNFNLIGADGFIGLTVFWVFCMFYFLFMAFYAMVFLIGGETSLWFYKSEQPSIAAPFKWLVIYQLGSVSLAAFLLALIKIAQLLVAIARSKNKAKGIAGIILAVVACMLSCLLRRFQYYTRIINNYSMIICAVTGQSYINSALTFACMLFSNIRAYCTFSLISYFLRIGGTFTCVFLPSLVSYFLFSSIPLDKDLVNVGVGIVIFFSFMVSVVVMETLVEAMDSMFVLYSLEASRGEFGQMVEQINEEQEMLEKIYEEGLEDQYMKIKRREKRGPEQVVEVINDHNRVVIEDGNVVLNEVIVRPQPQPPRIPAPQLGTLLKNIVNEGKIGSENTLLSQSGIREPAKRKPN